MCKCVFQCLLHLQRCLIEEGDELSSQQHDHLFSQELYTDKETLFLRHWISEYVFYSFFQTFYWPQTDTDTHTVSHPPRDMLKFLKGLEDSLDCGGGDGGGEIRFRVASEAAEASCLGGLDVTMEPYDPPSSWDAISGFSSSFSSSTCPRSFSSSSLCLDGLSLAFPFSRGDRSQYMKSTASWRSVHSRHMNNCRGWKKRVTTFLWGQKKCFAKLKQLIGDSYPWCRIFIDHKRTQVEVTQPQEDVKRRTCVKHKVKTCILITSRSKLSKLFYIILVAGKLV